jgi:putative restriction endonuclease
MGTDLRRHSNGLPDWHVNALRWFQNRVGSEEGWPEPLEDGTLLVTRAKGIYKPKGYDYALSVREVLDGPYPDREPQYNKDGSWMYHYFQENLSTHARDSEYTNKALLACHEHKVPVGVLIQTQSKSPVCYRVVGLALVSTWRDGYFVLEGFPASSSL